MTCLNINDAALARHIKQYARTDTADHIVYGPTGDTDKTDIIGTGYMVVKAYLNQLPKTRAALAECNVHPADTERIKTFIGLLHPCGSDAAVITPTKLILQCSHPTVSLRVYRSKDHLWYLDTRLLDIFYGTPELLSQNPIDVCYITGSDNLDAAILPYQPNKPNTDIRAATNGIKL